MKYTKEILESVAQKSQSFADMARFLGIAPVGSNTTHLKNRCKAYEIDTSHFAGQRHNKGRPARNRKDSSHYLVMGERKNGRAKRPQLFRSMIEIGISHSCEECGLLPEWNGKPLKLQIDHKNGMFWDNRKENLRFLCPNCHSQTDTWGRK